jgi:hypothetical protein
MRRRVRFCARGKFAIGLRRKAMFWQTERRGLNPAKDFSVPSRANATGLQLVMFVHGLSLLPSSWDR